MSAHDPAPCPYPGTLQGLARHRAGHERRCGPCAALRASQTAARPAPSPCPRPGTTEGWEEHRRAHGRLCGPCLAWAAANVATGGPAGRRRREMAPAVRDRCRRRAAARLRAKYPAVYRLLYEVELAKARQRMGRPSGMTMARLEALLAPCGLERDPETGEWRALAA